LPFQNAEESVLNVARATADNISSMLVDVLRGVQTEVDSINGAIVKEGEKLGVSVLINKTLCGLLKFHHASLNQLQGLQ
jgi:2-dehydropantoate 2-reductase